MVKSPPQRPQLPGNGLLSVQGNKPEGELIMITAKERYTRTLRSMLAKRLIRRRNKAERVAIGAERQTRKWFKLYQSTVFSISSLKNSQYGFLIYSDGSVAITDCHTINYAFASAAEFFELARKRKFFNENMEVLDKADAFLRANFSEQFLEYYCALGKAKRSKNNEK